MSSRDMIAGVEIQYSQGFFKQKFRRIYNDEVPTNLHANIAKLICTTRRNLTLDRVRHFARRTRACCRVY
ncbi:unnamed protein product, partial [Hapterophycus canaliculatus]